MYNWSIWLLVVGMLGSATSCKKAIDQVDGPKKRLTDYITTSFSVKKKEDKAQLVSFLSGEVKQRLEGWSDSQFQEAFIDKKRQFIQLVIKDVKPISEEETQITYELIYTEQGTRNPDEKNKPHEVKITNKKLCQMIKENGQWVISSVRNIKELLEFQDEFSLP
jgi:gas vesicle protein